MGLRSMGTAVSDDSASWPSPLRGSRWRQPDEGGPSVDSGMRRTPLIRAAGTFSRGGEKAPTAGRRWLDETVDQVLEILLPPRPWLRVDVLLFDAGGDLLERAFAA